MRELLFSVTKKDLVVETFRCGGHGGQNVNKVETGVRIRHPDSGAVVECRETRSQLDNKRLAFKKLAADPRFESWRKRKAAELMLTKQQAEARERRIEEKVARMMADENLLVEVGVDGAWTPADA
jgi:protein subunit release factor B